MNLHRLAALALLGVLLVIWAFYVRQFTLERRRRAERPAEPDQAKRASA